VTGQKILRVKPSAVAKERANDIITKPSRSGMESKSAVTAQTDGTASPAAGEQTPMGKIILSLCLSMSAVVWAGEKYTPQQLAARFYYDLGPAEVDVSSYPKDQQKNYRLFAKTCSQCHTLARPINSPIVERKDWRRYIQRMHGKTKMVSGIVISAKDAQIVVNFLSYDAQIRKVKNKAAFDAKANNLRLLFNDVQKERSRIQLEKDKRNLKESAPYTGT
jgi:cytochrome c5